MERHVAVLSVGRLEEIEVPDPGHDPWLAHTDRLPFPVEWSAQFDVLSGGEARQAIQRKLLVVRDMQRHYREHDLDEPLALDRQARQARQVEDQMSRGVEVAAARVHGWFRLAVSGRTEDECLERVRKVKASYRGRRVSIEHPKGQYGLLREFIPGEPVSTSAYRRRLPVLYVAAGVPMASSQVGDRRGPYVGYTAGSSRRAVMFDTHYATEVKETSGLVPVVGGLGAGKSVLLGQITYEAVRRGIPSVVLDPSGPLARLTELPEFRGIAEHLDLTTAASGTLNPFAVVARPSRSAFPTEDAYVEAEVLAAQDRKLLALDVVRMLLPPSLDAIPSTSLVISDAVRATRGEPDRVAVGRREAPGGAGRVARPGGRELPAGHGRAAAGPAVVPERRSGPGPAGRDADRADHAGSGAAAAVGARGTTGRPRSSSRCRCCIWRPGTPPAPSTGGAWRAASWWPWTRRTSSASGRPGGRCSPGWVGTPASGTPASWPPRRTRRTCSAWTSPTSCRPRSWVASRTRTPPATGSGCCGCPPGSATSGPWRTCRAGRGTEGFREFVMRDVDGHVDKIRVDLTANPSLLEALNTTAGRDTRDADEVQVA